MSRRKTEGSPFNFENSIAELEKIVDQLENDSLTLEQMISSYERGCFLLKSCDATLKSTRQRLEKISLRDESAENGLAFDTDPCKDIPTATPTNDTDDTICLF